MYHIEILNIAIRYIIGDSVIRNHPFSFTLGNDAIAHAALESGLNFAAAIQAPLVGNHPGTGQTGRAIRPSRGMVYQWNVSDKERGSDWQRQ